MKVDVKSYVAQCLIYQKNKALATFPTDLLQALEILKRIWEELTMDFIEGLPRASGFNIILVVVDRLSKTTHFICLKHPFTTKVVAEVFINEVVRLHGFPKTIVSNRDKIFLKQFLV